MKKSKPNWHPVLTHDGRLFCGWWGSVVRLGDMPKKIEACGREQAMAMPREVDCDHVVVPMKLKIEEGVTRGRSSVSFELTSLHGHKYHVGPLGMMKIAMGLANHQIWAGNGWIQCKWRQVKQGQRYSIEPVLRG